jgi:hypothetical protein
MLTQIPPAVPLKHLAAMSPGNSSGAKGQDCKTAVLYGSMYFLLTTPSWHTSRTTTQSSSLTQDSHALSIIPEITTSAEASLMAFDINMQVIKAKFAILNIPIHQVFLVATVNGNKAGRKSQVFQKIVHN